MQPLEQSVAFVPKDERAAEYSHFAESQHLFSDFSLFAPNVPTSWHTWR
jgi:hypothetical protein